MRRVGVGLAIACTVATAIPVRNAHGQAPRSSLGVTAGYLRVVGEDGFDVDARLLWSLPTTSGIAHAVGIQLEYGETGLAPRAGPAADHRGLLALGARYELYPLGQDPAGGVRPFLAVPVQALHAWIPDPPIPTTRGASSAAVDGVGGTWGFGIGAETGLGIRLAPPITARLSGGGMYHTLYGGEAGHMLWRIGGGLSLLW